MESMYYTYLKYRVAYFTTLIKKKETCYLTVTHEFQNLLCDRSLFFYIKNIKLMELVFHKT